MAGPEVIQHGPLNIGYSTGTSVYQPGNVSVPSGAGALWAGVGDTALKAAGLLNNTAGMLQQSPQNPAVYAQMKAQESASQAGIADQLWRNSLPNNFGRLMEYTDDRGNVVSIAPGQIQDPTTLANLQTAMKVGAGAGTTGHGRGPAVDKTTAGDGGSSDSSTTTTGDQSFEGSEYPPAGQQPQPQPQPKKKQPPTAEQQAHPGSTSISNVSPALMAGGTDEQALAAARAAGSSGAAPEGTPSSMTFLNPATGNIEARQTEAPGMFASKPSAPAPAAPAAQPQPAQSQTPAAATQADQAAMQQWQNQNAHPVMSSQDALAWAKNQSTLNQDATYLPMGGPGGSPAFAFHVKGGGMNIVPVSQMVAKGAGPLVAAQNTSQVISSTDQQNGQQPGGMPTGTGASANQPSASQGTPPPAQPPQQYPNISPPPPANLPQQPNISPPPATLPPAAPTGPLPGAQAQPQYPNISPPAPPPAPGTLAAARMPITDAQGNPLSAYTNVPSKGGLTPEQLGAQTTSAGQPAQPVTIQPQRDMWDTVPAAQQATVTAQAKAMGPANGPYAGDRRVEGDTGPYTYYINDDPNSKFNGRVYTTLPGPAGGYYEEKRWYLGTKDYDRYELPATQMKQHMKDYWSTQAGQLTPQEIDAMTPEDMKPWLQRAWYNDHMATSAPTTGYNSDLDAAEQYHKSLVRIGNLLQTLDNHGYSNLSSFDRVSSIGANTAQSLGVPGGTAIAQMDSKSAQAMRLLDQEVAYAEGLARAHPGLQLRTSESQGLDLQKVTIPTQVGPFGLPNVGGSTPLSDIAFSGEDLKTKLDRLHAMQTTGNARYQDLITQGSDQRMVVAPKHDANVIRITKGQDLVDAGDQYAGHSYPGDPPTVKAENVKEFARTHPPGTPFMTYGRNARPMATKQVQ